MEKKRKNMNETPKTLLKIRQSYSSFHGKYVRIADRILQNPGILIRDKVSDVSAICGCDNAQIIRFCQKLGFKGFSDMKRAIAHDLIPLRTDVDPADLGKNGSFDRLTGDFRKDYLRTVNDTVSMLDEKTVLRTAEAIRKAKKIMICGAGASGIVGEDLQMKLVRMGYSAFCHKAPAMNKMLCSLLDRKDILIAISFRGENPEILQYVKTAKKNGCRIAAITNFPLSPLAAEADLPLITAAEEDDFRIGAMTSRISQLMIVDILSIVLASNDMKKTGLALAKTHTILHENEEAEK